MKLSFSVLGALVSTFVFVACTGDQGPQGDPGTATAADGGPGATGSLDPSVSGVSPTRAFLARKVDVSLSGNGTKWTDATTVDFGAGITVDKVVVASPTAILASITIADTAAVGARDVTVKGDVASVYKGAFVIDSPIDIEVKGTAAQGSVFFLTLHDKDLTTPFDTTANSSILGTTYLGLQLPKIAGATLQIQSVTEYQAEVAVFVDVTAKPGAAAFTLISGVDGAKQTSFPFPQGVDIAARTAETLAVGTAKPVDVTKPYQSQLYQLTPGAALAFLDVGVTTNDQGFAPAGILLSKDGKFSTALTGFGAANTLLTSSADPIYVIVADTSGATGGYSVKGVAATATSVAEGANHGSMATAQDLATLPSAVTDGALSSGSEADWYMITASAGDIGKSIRALTAPGDSNTDTVIQVFKDGGTALGDAVDDSFHENYLSGAIPAAGKYFVKVTYSTYSTWAASASHYKLAVRFE